MPGVWGGAAGALFCGAGALMAYGVRGRSSTLFAPSVYRGPAVRRSIALTFDDGPNAKFTTDLLELLQNQNILATFFLVGANVEKYPEITKNIYKSGHLIGNHSMNHKFMNYFITGHMNREVLQSQKVFKNILGKKPTLFRPPWLFRYPGLFRLIAKNNMQMVSGKFCYAFEVFQPNAGIIAKSAISKSRPGAILIFHDGVESKGGNRSQTIESVRILIDELKKQNYTFVTVDKLLGITKPYTN